MLPSHLSFKDFDKRSTVEANKVKNIATAMEKVKKAIDLEKKSYCVEFKKGLD